MSLKMAPVDVTMNAVSPAAASGLSANWAAVDSSICVGWGEQSNDTARRLPGLKGVNRGLRILLVEDSDTDAELIRMILEDDKRVDRVDHAVDGAEALDLLNRIQTPDLVITDLNMPTMRGAEFMRNLREWEQRDSVEKFSCRDLPRALLPIVVLTSSGRISDFHETTLAAANTFVTKPDSCAALSRILKQFIKTIIWGGELPRYLTVEPS